MIARSATAPITIPTMAPIGNECEVVDSSECEDVVPFAVGIELRMEYVVVADIAG